MIKHITWLLLFIGSSIILYSQDNLLDNYSQSISPTEISWITIGDLSGITWNKENNRLYMIENGNGTIWVSDYSFNVIRTIEGGSFGDTEDMAHLSGNEFAIVTEAGFKSVLWNATNDYGKPVSAGVYLYQIQAGDFVQTKKMVLLK